MDALHLLMQSLTLAQTLSCGVQQLQLQECRVTHAGATGRDSLVHLTSLSLLRVSGECCVTLPLDLICCSERLHAASCLSRLFVTPFTCAGPCVNLPLHFYALMSVALEQCRGVNDGCLLHLLSRAHSLRSLSVVECVDVTATGFSSMTCTRLCQLEIVRCANVEPDSVMAASVQMISRSLRSLNISHGRLGSLQLQQLPLLSTLILDMCGGVTPAAAAAVVGSCRLLRLLSAAGVAAFCCHEVRQERFLQLKNVTIAAGADVSA
jgi:hypothetical protein